MLGYIDKIKEISARLLKEEKVDVIIGFKKGSLPMMNEPCMIKNSEDVDALVWDSNCRLNLANYLTNRKDKIGIIAKGCDSRNIVNHIIENKIKREQLVVIGVPCKGMNDKSKMAALVEGEVTEVIEDGDKVTVKSASAEKTVEKKEVIQDNCAICLHRNPVIYDEIVDTLVEEQKDIDPYANIREIEGKSSEEKWSFFEDLFANCTRCYACKNACPLCFCPTCFVDESRPQWVGKGPDPVDVRTYHFLRAFHCAGRCTDCGACEAACPMDIKIRYFTKKLEKECVERYGWEPGLTLDTRPALDTFKTNDPQEFIK